MQPSERNKQERVWIQIWCNVRKCGTVDKSSTATHLNRNDCHPTVRDSEMVDSFPRNIV